MRPSSFTRTGSAVCTTRVYGPARGEVRSAREHEETLRSIQVRVFMAHFGLYEEAVLPEPGDNAADHHRLADRERRLSASALDFMRQVKERR